MQNPVMSRTPSADTDRRVRNIVFALYGAIVFIGLSICFIQPPFEGLDETAHYSRIISTAYSSPSTRLDSHVEEFQKIAPLQDYQMIMKTPKYEFVKTATPEYGNSYAGMNTDESLAHHSFVTFFLNEKRVHEYLIKYRETSSPKVFSPGKLPNWEYQHPPLFYYFMAPMARGLDNLSLVDRAIALRSINFIFVLIAYALGLYATFNYAKFSDTKLAYNTLLFGTLFPFLCPAFWQEFCRLSNENICALICSFGWFFLLRHLRDPGKRSIQLLLGLFMVLGGMAKITMLFVSLGVLGFLVARSFKNRNATMAPTPFPVATFLVFFSTQGIWLLYQNLVIHAPGSLEIIWITHDKDFLSRFLRSFDIELYSLAFERVLFSGIYGWAFLFLGTVFSLFIVPALLLYFFSLSKSNITQVTGLPAWMIAPPMMMLLAHMTYCMVEIDGHIMTSCRYLFVALPAFIVIFGVGTGAFLRLGRYARIFVASFFTIIPFGIGYIFWYFVQIFGGCGIIEQKGLPVGAAENCFYRLDWVLKNLQIHTWMYSAFVCFALGLIFLLYGLLRLHNFINTTDRKFENKAFEIAT